MGNLYHGKMLAGEKRGDLLNPLLHMHNIGMIYIHTIGELHWDPSQRELRETGTI